jgi:2-polyprenyl-6-methoxyphenol hydroxylase-like FAD-dependent oxidoreductase
LIYWVPSPETGAAVGNRRLNWGFHETIAGKNIPGVEPDENGFVRKGLAPGAATAEQVAYCQGMARQYFPAYIADIVELTSQPFIQPVIDVFVPRYTRGRLCLMGDAATLARPHIGGGAGKALDDALALGDALAAHDSLDDALAAWDNERSAVGNEVVSLGQSFGRYLVEEHPNWDAMDQESMDRRWRELMQGRYWYMVDEVKDRHPTLRRRA